MNIADEVAKCYRQNTGVDANFENANVVDAINSLSVSATHIASAINQGTGRAYSIEQAFFEIASGIRDVARSIEMLAEAVAEVKSK